jgi:hypothetical protein
VSQSTDIAIQKPHDGKGKFVRTPEQIALDHEAAQMRSLSKTYREIGERFGVNPSSAYQMVRRAIEDIPREVTTELVALELAKIDYLEQRAVAVMEKRHVFVSQGGKVVYDGEEKLEDDGPTLQAINTLAKLGERRAKLLGLNAPVRTELTSTNVTVSLEARSEQARDAVLGLLARLANDEKPTIEGASSEIPERNTE